MPLIYAFGGGSGHLTRARALIHTLGLDEATPILCAQRQAQEGRSGEGLGLERAPPGLERDLEAFRSWLREVLARRQTKTVFVDTFPCGILGELADFPWPGGVELVLVGRILRSEAYASLPGTAPPYSKTLLIEDVAPEQFQFLSELSGSVERLELIDPPAPLDPAADEAIAFLRSSPGPVWLVVHSGPEDETAELLGYARATAEIEGISPRFLVVTDNPLADPGSDTTQLSLSPARVLFPFADGIVTACGSNSMRQSREWAGKRLCLPFERRLDDQFLRRRLGTWTRSR